MEPWKRNRKFLSGFFFALALGVPLAFGMGKKQIDPNSLKGNPHRISDSLVSDLACSELTPENVLEKVRPDAFSIERHIPVQNWPSNLIANCWSLSHAQRLIFYFGRFNEQPQASDTERVLNYLRGAELSYDPAENPGQQLKSSVIQRYAPFAIDGSSLPGSRFFETLEEGISAERSAARIPRNFRSEIESYQVHRFYDPGNVGLISGSRERSQEDNEKTLLSLLHGLQAHRLPMVVLRPSLSTQHVVLIKRIEADNGDQITFDVYDSNFWEQENRISYSRVTREFTAPDVVRWFGVDPDAPIGVFLEDEDDMDNIALDLYLHYSEACVKLGQAP